LLRYGAVYLEVRYNVSVRGDRRTDGKGDVTEDRVPTAYALIGSMNAEVNPMTESLKLEAKTE